MKLNFTWISKQFEWIKSFFDHDDLHGVDRDGHNPDSKNLLGIGLVIIFAVSYLKRSVVSLEFTDIPSGWQMVLLGILGIRALQSGAATYIKSRNGNGNGNGKVNHENPPPDPEK